MDTHKPTHIIDLQTKQYFQKPKCVVASNQHMSDLKIIWSRVDCSSKQVSIMPGPILVISCNANVFLSN